MSTANGGVTFGEYNMRAPTFIPVNGTGYKLGDLKLTGISDSGNTRVMFLNDGGATAKITAEMVGEECFKEYEGKSAIFKYYPSGDEYEGWYLDADWEESLFILDDIVKIGRGQGFLLDVKDANAVMQFAGQVDPGDEGEIALPHRFGEYNVLGNVTPTDLKIGDFVLSGVSDSGNSRIVFLNDGGATKKIDAAMVGQECFNTYGAKASAIFKFYPPDDSWYLDADWEDGMFPMNTIVNIPAGQAFIFDAKDKNSILTIPSALTPKAK